MGGISTVLKFADDRFSDIPVVHSQVAAFIYQMVSIVMLITMVISVMMVLIMLLLVIYLWMIEQK